jgi:hypothetical protein
VIVLFRCLLLSTGVSECEKSTFCALLKVTVHKCLLSYTHVLIDVALTVSELPVSATCVRELIELVYEQECVKEVMGVCVRLICVGRMRGVYPSMEASTEEGNKVRGMCEVWGCLSDMEIVVQLYAVFTAMRQSQRNSAQDMSYSLNIKVCQAFVYIVVSTLCLTTHIFLRCFKNV